MVVHEKSYLKIKDLVNLEKNHIEDYEGVQNYSVIDYVLVKVVENDYMLV